MQLTGRENLAYCYCILLSTYGLFPTTNKTYIATHYTDGLHMQGGGKFANFG